MAVGAFAPTASGGRRATQQLHGLFLISLLCGAEFSTIGASGPPRESLAPRRSQSEGPPHGTDAIARQNINLIPPSDAPKPGPVAAPNERKGEEEATRRTEGVKPSCAPQPQCEAATVVAGGSSAATDIADREVADLSRPARRLTAVNPSFQINTVRGTNIQDEPRSATNINVRAGVSYQSFTIFAESGLGTDPATIQVKLVPYDMASTLTTCALVTAYMGLPFDGSTSQASNAEDIRNDFTPDDGFSFPRAGKWRLCYTANGVQWEELSTAITVLGAETTDYKMWCAVSLLKREICQNTPKQAPGCECMGKIEGVKLQSVPPYGMTILGLPDPVAPAWKITLIEDEKQCGDGNMDPFEYKISEVVNYEGYEVHNFGPKKAGTTVGVWKVCYCVGFDADNGAGSQGVVSPCYQEAPEDFVQTIGRLISIDTKTKQGSVEVTVYPTLRFSLELQCGSVGAAGTGVQAVGGCTATEENRYKIIEKKPENDLLYFDASAGCRFLEEVTTTIDNAITIGGHLGPDNCEQATICHDSPEILGPKIPTWTDVQIDASYENNVMIGAEYDVCYCDGNCQNSMYWFKAGEIRVEPVSTILSDNGERAVEPVVNTNYYIVIKGLEGAGSWSSTGSRTREMKVLRDTDGFVDKIACLSLEQPDVISGHRLVSGNTDYTDPSATVLNGASRPIGQRYGEVRADPADANTAAPNIKILEAGWYAICYCDSNCNEMLNWAVFGRALVSGPILNQEWTRYSGVPFDIDVKGWRLAKNRLRILSTANEPADCGTVGQSDRVHGPAGQGKLLRRGSYDALVTAMVYDPAGTEITFSKQHGLKDGDRISLTGVNVPPSIQQTKMFNTDHEVFVSCDDQLTGCYKVLIPVRFPPSFVELEIASVDWIRSSVQSFSDIKISQASPEGRGYIVCWSPDQDNDEAFVGQAGKIIVKDPIEMAEASMGLTTVQPNVPSGGAPIVISFKTGDIPWYAQADGQLQLKIVIMSAQKTADGENAPAGPYIKAIEARDYALSSIAVTADYNEVAKANQAICGKVFMELWSEDPMGFPQPDGCWIDEDKVNVDQPLLQLHILFGQRNHLKKLTKYIMVINAQVMPDLEADFPPDGLVYIWSMDDVHTRPYDVLELGRAYPRPVTRVPPRDPFGVLQLNTGTDPQFHPTDGFKILPDEDGGQFKELLKYCKAFDTRYPDITPKLEDECKVCEDEQDCGNGDLQTPPNPALNWCVSPVDPQCPDARGELSNVPTFSFSLRAKPSRPIVAGSIIRVFLHPLTQWDIITTPCPVAMVSCTDPDQNGPCGPVLCEAEAAIGGTVVGRFSEFPINIMKIKLPNIMAAITDLVSHTVSVGSIALPPGGIMPQVVTAELMTQQNFAPDYWGRNSIATGGARIYVRPKVIAASIVTFLGDGNSLPFRGDQKNTLYFRLVMGTTLWAENGDGIAIRIKPPLGYTCAQESEGVPVPELGVLNGVFPSTKGKLGTNRDYEAQWVNIATPQVACELLFRQHMVLYAGSVVFVSIRVMNPIRALKRDLQVNHWKVIVEDTINNKQMPEFIATGEGVSEMYNLDSTAYGGSVSVLGKLSNMVIAPANFGVMQNNVMSIFFKTEQEVGDINGDIETEVWVDAPSGFDFGQYCSAEQLPSNYYIPEPAVQTFELPAGPLILCTGAPTSAEEHTYNRAKVKTTGRLLQETLYGFTLKVTNADNYVRSQLNEWHLWTYMKSGAGVDGAFETVRFNEKVAVGPDTSFGIYQKSMPPGSLVVSVADMRPTVAGMEPTYIQFLPIMVSLPMQKAVRILAPAGYIWDFEQTEFRYKAPSPGVPESQIVAGAEEDLPISGVPARPIAEPRNQLTIDYMQATWTPGVKYGFVAKIRVPMLPPTASANQFSIEFGYSEPLFENRLEAGVVAAPLVRRVTNGQVSYTTSVQALETQITLSMRTVTMIPRAGGIVIVGPPNFIFDALCQPKPAKGFPELAFDSTCLFKQIVATGQAKISIVAGMSGIPAAFYRFSLTARNPPQQVLLQNAGEWIISTYTVVAEESMLDYQTAIPGYAVSIPMLSAKIIKPPKVHCHFLTPAQQAIEPDRPITYCPMEDWLFWPPRGFRDDRPGHQSMIVFQFQLSNPGVGTQDIMVKAPIGYKFNTECVVITDPGRIFDDSVAHWDIPASLPDGFAQKYGVWPFPNDGARVQYCKGRENFANIGITRGLGRLNRYLFRLSVLENPVTTPIPNSFVLEYNGEASDPFEGPEIWAFTNGTIEPRTTAASLRDRPTHNLVTIQLRPVSTIPNGGHLWIESPSGFMIPEDCQVSVRVREDEMPNISAVPPGADRNAVLEYVEFIGNDIDCVGDTTESSRARLHIIGLNKYLMHHVLYVFELFVINPQTTTKDELTWNFKSYEDSSPNKLLDSASFPGFPINDAADTFEWMTPNSVNALVVQLLEFNMTFPEIIGIGDRIEIVAPVTYFFNEHGDSRCKGYLFLDGSMRRTQPTCGANTIAWHLTEESVPAMSSIRFMVNVKNPPRTPEINLFQVRQLAPDERQKSSRMILGFEIIPRLSNPSVLMTPPTGYCRSDISVVTGMNCDAAGSMSAIVVSFTPTRSAGFVRIRGRVDQDIFDFSKATLPSSLASTAIVAERLATHIIVGLDLRTGQQASFAVHDILNPSIPGKSKWSITTYLGAGAHTPENRRDEVLDLEFFSLVQYIDLVSSRVTPIYYSAKAATIMWQLTPLMALEARDVLRITRPLGYTILEDALVTTMPLQALESGLDFMRRWSSDYENPEDYYVVVGTTIPAATTIRFSIGSDLPSKPEPVSHWYFRAYKVLPLYDVDGEELDASPVPYPWVNRGLQATGTNDGAFPGFLLVGQIPFKLAASLQTPGAEIRLSINFGLSAGVEAEDVVKLDVKAPHGFVFKDSCLYTGSAQFSKCTGYRHTASLTTVLPRLRGVDITVHLAALNPADTPVENRWTVAVYKDDDTQYVNWSEAWGYDIAAMVVTYKGNNQLAAEATGYFEFTPVRSSSSPVLYIEIIPPADQGYRLLCEGVQPLGFYRFSGKPRCVGGNVNEPLELRFGNATIMKDTKYTFGVGVLNPGGNPASKAHNMWGILIKDHTKQTFDGNLRVQGLDLKSVPVRCEAMGWTTSLPRVLNTIAILLRVFYTIQAGLVTKIVIGAPKGVMYNEDPKTVTVAPMPLPLLAANRREIEGEKLSLNLDETRDISRGKYNIRFEVSNPGTTDWDHTWSIFVMKDIETEFSNLLVGYVEGEVSPVDVGTEGSGDSGYDFDGDAQALASGASRGGRALVGATRGLLALPFGAAVAAAP